MRLHLDGTIGPAPGAAEGGTRDLQIVTLPEGVFLYASSGAGGGLTSYALSPGEMAAAHDALPFADHLEEVAGPHLAVLEGAEGAAQLVFGGGSSGLVARTLDDHGGFGTETQIDGPASAPLALAQTTLDDAGVLHVAGADGIATLVKNGSDGYDAQVGGGADLAGVAALETVETGGGRFLLAADTQDHGVTGYRVDPEIGALEEVSSMGAADGLGVQAPTAMASVEGYDAAWVVLAGGGSDSLSVMRVDADGALTPTDHVIDTAATQLGAVQALEVVEANGQILVLAAGGDGGVSLFSLLPDGRLVHRDSIEAGVETVSALTATVLDDTLQIHLGAEDNAALTQISVPLDGLGELRHSAPEDGTQLEASEGGDILVAQGAGDTLVGGAGDDILVAGPEDTVMRSGEGADIFVLRGGGGEARVQDFRPGHDRLDLSDWAMLRNPDQLDITPTEDGARITWDDEVLVLHAHDGTPLARDDLFGAHFDTPDRLLVLADDEPWVDPEEEDEEEDEPSGLLIFIGWGESSAIGSSGNDTIHGNDADNVIDGYGGDNEIHTGGGDNRVVGSSGDNTIYGGDGDNSLWGGAGNNVIYGGLGDDRIGLGPGGGYAEVAGGNNTIYGGIGDSTIHGADGDDRLWGMRGDNEIYGGLGDDRIGGGNGAAYIEVEGGNNTLYGGVGENDNTLIGGTGDDELHAMAGDGFVDATAGGNNLIRGGAGDDEILGGAGDDTIVGGQGNDVLTGGGGADTFVFRANHDHNTITDFDVSDGDMLLLEIGNPYAATDLWSGDLDAQDVVDQFAEDDGDGNTVIVFANGESITLQGFDYGDRNTLVSQIEIVEI